MGARLLRYGEAVELLRTQFAITSGEAQGAVWQAIASREICCAWTEAAIKNQERLAPRSTRGGFNVRHSADYRAAHERSQARLRLLTEFESAAFKDELIAGNIVLTESDLLSWYTRERVPAPAAERTPKISRASQKQIVAIVTDYRKSLLPIGEPSIETLSHFARAAGLVGHRAELRAEYARQFPGRRRGRPAKN
jgi:hypothetical protein